MAFKAFAPGVLTSSDVNTFLMRQSVITCTSSTRPASPNEGMTIYETDTDKTLQYSGSAWVDVLGLTNLTSYTPVLGGTGWAVGNGSLIGAFQRMGNTVHFFIEFTIGSTTTKGSPVSAANALTFTLPTSLPNTPSLCWGYCSDASTSVVHFGAGAKTNVPNVLQVYTLAGTSNYTGIYSNTPFTWDTGDILLIQGVQQ
jgi:uncharacterized membrane protein